MILKGYIVPGKPHPLLAHERAPHFKKLRQAFDVIAKEIEILSPDILLLYSTQWISVLGHQVQADPNPEWTQVDQEWHDLGTIHYKFLMDSEFSKTLAHSAQARGLHARTVNTRGFPIDTGTCVALSLLNPQNRFKASVVSCNMYADKNETVILGKSALDALKASQKKAVAIAVTSLSNRIFTTPVPDSEDRIHSLKDDEWNQKILELLSEGRLEDVSQLAREFSQQANGDQKMKALWWLSSVMGQTNQFDGKIYEYQPICGSGAALVGLTPSHKQEFERDFDEQSFETIKNSTEILPQNPSTTVTTSLAPKPVGAYPHSRFVGDFIFLSGVGPRQPGTNEIPGGPIHDEREEPRDYDIEAQTRAVVKNVECILIESGSSLESVVDITVFLTNMKRDFKKYNEVYAEYFSKIQPTRTTLSISALPTPIAIEMKVIAKRC